MAKMVNMARTAADKKAERDKYSDKSPYAGEDYPYGLSVSLDHEGLSKLGLNGPLPKVGSKIPLTANAHVKSTSEESTDGTKRRRMTLELRHMALDHGQSAEPEEANEESTKQGMKSAMDKALATGSESGRAKARSSGKAKQV